MSRVELPALLGEVDILKVVQLLPGVQSDVEGTSGIYIRGSGPDPNPFLLDGTQIYNPTHVFGFLSTFNGDTINGRESPPKYGTRGRMPVLPSCAVARPESGAGCVNAHVRICPGGPGKPGSLPGSSEGAKNTRITVHPLPGRSSPASDQIPESPGHPNPLKNPDFSGKH